MGFVNPYTIINQNILGPSKRRKFKKQKKILLLLLIIIIKIQFYCFLTFVHYYEM